MASKKVGDEGFHSDPEALYQKATSTELAQDYNAAFKLYVTAAQGFLHQASSTAIGNHAELSRCKSRAGACLSRAELIKATHKDSLKPVTRNPFTNGTSNR